MKLWMLLIFVPLLSISHNSVAGIGTITEQVNTPPSIQRQKTTLTGAKGQGVEMNDLIRTARGKVGITFEDKTQVQVSENSKLVIDDFVYDPKKGAGKVGLNMALGTVRYASGQIAKKNPQAVAIHTPTATVGVRGTDFTATVDELGASTFILLPSCPVGYKDIERDCKTGAIEVTSEAGTVLLNRPFQATRVDTKNTAPLKPVILKLTEDAINNMLIVAPPKEFKTDNSTVRVQAKGALDVDFLKETGLVNEFDKQEPEFKDKLSQNLLDQNFLANVLDIINSQLAAEQNLLNTQKSGLLPDYKATTGVVAEVDDLNVTLWRNDGSNVASVTVPKTQNSTIILQQGPLEIKNRVNSGGGTTITVIQR